MATTGVPNQLYQGTDAPDLVDGAYATHKHTINTVLVKNISEALTCFKINEGANHLYIITFRAIPSMDIPSDGSDATSNMQIGVNIPSGSSAETIVGAYGNGTVKAVDGDTPYGYIPLHIESASKQGSNLIVELRASVYHPSAQLKTSGAAKVCLFVITQDA